MKNENVEGKVMQLIYEQLGVDPDRVKLETNIVDELGADSLDVVELVLNLEEEFDIEISEEDDGKFKVVGDAIEYVKGKLAS